MADLRSYRKEMRGPVRPKDQRAHEGRDTQHPDEKKALFRLRREARDSGATLHSNGEGGLASSLVLGVMRRDGFRCVKCKTHEDLQVHHKAGVVTSARVSKMGHANQPYAIETICHSCHEGLHEAAKRAGIDSSQVLPEGDVGSRHDHGQPVYKE